LFKNGVQLNTVIANGTINTTTEDLYIGGMLFNFTNFYLKGSIDEISLWNRALNPAEIMCYMRSGVPNGAIGLLNYYKCNQGTAGGINVNQSVLYDQTGSIDGNLLNFALSGPTSNFVTGVSTVTDIADTYCSGGSYTFGTQILTAPGVYTESFPTALGCDSTVRLTLTDITLNTTVIAVDESLTALAPGLNYQWIDCQNGNQPVPGANSQSFTPSVSSDYAVVVSNGICSDTSACNIVTVGINEGLQLQGFSVYPNPATDHLFIRSATVSSASVTVSDIAGRSVFQHEMVGHEIRIDTNSWPKGIYSVEVKSGDSRAVYRVTR
ncbi:MAG: T9SS type A sorting domain-containing protein, partial [Bacteroidota bacterium]